ncbi:hypothetical protein F4824DRAFT_513982 [Ustulina deusta]|nr:hypothetical protein F4824DRAFT_513982 [Ustulina deusta]
MAFQGCESIFEPILGFPLDFESGGQYLLCGLSVLTDPQSAWSPTTKPEIDEAHITWWHQRGNPGAIVVGEPEAGDEDAIRPGTYLLVHGQCGRRTPGKIGINYCWTHGEQGYQVYEEIHNKALGPDSRLSRLNFGETMEDFLRRLRKAGVADEEEDWKTLLDDILEGRRQGIRATWRNFIEPLEAGQSMVADSAHPSPAY